MPYNTRLDGRSPTNKVISIKNDSGLVVATIEATGKSADLAVTTSDGYKVEKGIAHE
jgi:glutamine cyclotransferase